MWILSLSDSDNLVRKFTSKLGIRRYLAEVACFKLLLLLVSSRPVLLWYFLFLISLAFRPLPDPQACTALSASQTASSEALPAWLPWLSTASSMSRHWLSEFPCALSWSSPFFGPVSSTLDPECPCPPAPGHWAEARYIIVNVNETQVNQEAAERWTQLEQLSNDYCGTFPGGWWYKWPRLTNSAN